MPLMCKALCLQLSMLLCVGTLLAYEAKAQVDLSSLGSQIPGSLVQGVPGVNMQAVSGSIPHAQPAMQDPLSAMPSGNPAAQANIPSKIAASDFQGTFNYKVQDPDVRLIAPQTAPTVGSDPGPTLTVTKMPVGTVKPVPGAKKVYPSVPATDAPLLDPLPMPDLGPDPLAHGDDDLTASLAKPSICPQNPVFRSMEENTSFSSICQANLYTRADRRSWSSCSGFFVSPTHFALAGHCVATAGAGRYKVVQANGRFGTVCCRTTSSTGPDNCESGYGFDIISVVSTAGFLNMSDYSNDGAVLKLTRPSYVASGEGLALRYAAPSPFCYSAPVTWGGYLGSPSPSSIGCNQTFNNRFFYTQTVGIASCTTATNKPSLVFRGSSCPGLSGGPLYTADNTVIGILSQTSNACSSGATSTSFTYFAAVTDGGTSWGVPLRLLINALG